MDDDDDFACSVFCWRVRANSVWESGREGKSHNKCSLKLVILSNKNLAFFLSINEPFHPLVIPSPLPFNPKISAAPVPETRLARPSISCICIHIYISRLARVFCSEDAVLVEKLDQTAGRSRGDRRGDRLGQEQPIGREMGGRSSSQEEPELCTHPCQDPRYVAPAALV